MPIEDYDEEPVELTLECSECEMEYAIYVNMDGFLEQARYCPFCGAYDPDYDRSE
tara:strand:+ start:3220 stop:3384 length:165 start_codon:yes stop_codon:yes gene_type:complete